MLIFIKDAIGGSSNIGNLNWGSTHLSSNDRNKKYNQSVNDSPKHTRPDIVEISNPVEIWKFFGKKHLVC